MTGSKDDLTLDMEQGSHELEKDKSPPAEASSSRKRNIWQALGALLFMGIVIFVVAFPITYLNDSDDSSDEASSDPEQQVQREFVSSNSPFEVKLAMFNEEIKEGYNNTEELKEDLRNAAKFLLNNVLNRNTGKEGYGSVGFGQRNPNIDVMPVFEDAPMAGAPPEAARDESKAVGDDFDDYGSNNQEEGVEEGDMIVSNGENVYAAYGDSIVVWDPRSGKNLTTVVMPAIKDERSRELSMFAPYYEQKPYIRHLLVQGDRLLVVVEGYGEKYRHSTTREYPVLYNYLSTHIRLYKIVNAEEGFLSLVSKEDLNGRFSDVRVVDGNAHVVTTSGIDTYSDLIAPFEYYNFEGLSREDYIKEVTSAAEEKAIPHFVDSLVQELSAGGGLPKLFRISIMQSEASGTQVEELVFGDGVVNAITQVHSFDMSSDSDKIVLIKSGTFLPTDWVQVYGAENALVVSGQGWEYNSKEGTSIQSTHLFGVAIDGASSEPGAVGTVRGYLLNSHSVDVKGDVLRVATTIRETRFFRPLMEEPMPMDETNEEFLDDEEVSQGDKSSGADEGTSVSVAAEDVPPEEESSTQNYVITMDLTAMTELGRIKLGKPNEVFTAVRFFDNVAYAVTFERRDPLYVLDLEDPKNPTKISELDVSGFSAYMHSLNDDNSLILAIGEEADDEGFPLGVQISIFDMKDFSAPPELAQRYVIEKDHDTYSYSDSLWDFMSIRYAAGRLIIPIDISGSENFHGFVVFIANENLIEEECRVSHAPPKDDGLRHCYHCGSSLPRRSMIFDGDLMTTESHFVRSTDMDTCKLNWKLDIESTDKNNACCYGYDDFILE